MGQVSALLEGVMRCMPEAQEALSGSSSLNLLKRSFFKVPMSSSVFFFMCVGQGMSVPEKPVEPVCQDVLG